MASTTEWQAPASTVAIGRTAYSAYIILCHHEPVIIPQHATLGNALTTIQTPWPVEASCLRGESRALGQPVACSHPGAKMFYANLDLTAACIV